MAAAGGSNVITEEGKKFAGLPLCSDRILQNKRIRGKQDAVMLNGLTHEHSIERIAMEKESSRGMCRYRGDTSCRLAIEVLKYVFRERLEEGGRYRKASFGQANRTGTRRSRWERCDFRDRLVAFAHQNAVTCFELCQILRKMRFGFMDI